MPRRVTPARAAAAAIPLLLGALLAAPAAAGEAEGEGEGGDARPAHERPLLEITLPGSLQINGHFDLAYERIAYTDDPTEGRDALRNYHRFLFVSRHVEGEILGFDAEVLGLYFYEVSARWRPRGLPLELGARLGKILVPFGAEPVVHHAYGGLSGFDQRLLPVVWSRHGLSGSLRGRWRGLRFTGDLYLVQGFRLERAGDVLDLQADLAPVDDVRFAFGGRLGLSWGPVTLWYSFLANGLGFDRVLFMQAVDLAVWKPTRLPVLRGLTLQAGAVRADVSGGRDAGVGGPGKDYYHFASYLEVRYYALPWLYAVGRTGLQTMNNRRGLYIDETRLGPDDRTVYVVGVAARYRGLGAGLYHFWILEKRGEIPNDMLRLRVSYDF